MPSVTILLRQLLIRTTVQIRHTNKSRLLSMDEFVGRSECYKPPVQLSRVDICRVRGVQYVFSMMHKCIMVKIGQAKNIIKQKQNLFNENRENLLILRK